MGGGGLLGLGLGVGSKPVGTPLMGGRVALILASDLLASARAWGRLHNGVQQDLLRGASGAHGVPLHPGAPKVIGQTELHLHLRDWQLLN